MRNVRKFDEIINEVKSVNFQGCSYSIHGAKLDINDGFTLGTGFGIKLPIYSLNRDRFKAFFELMPSSCRNFGIWRDGAYLYIDDIEVINDFNEAFKKAKVIGEKAIYDNKSKKVIWVD